MDHRRCVKSTCGASATNSLAFDYGARTAWLGDLTSERQPTAYDLCAYHAERFSVPRGWDRVDRRSSTPPLFVARRIEAV